MKILCHIIFAFNKQILPNKTCQHNHLIEGVSNWPLKTISKLRGKRKKERKKERKRERERKKKLKMASLQTNSIQL